jgi:hypothetical protein
MLLAAVVAATRYVSSGSWLPRGTWAVVSFVVAELVLIPLSCLVLATSLVWQVLSTRAGGGGTREGKGTAALPGRAAGVVVLVAVVSTILFARAIFPVLSRKLEWGRYGFQPPVMLRSLSPITTKLQVRLPPQTRLIEGEFIAGPGEHLFALLEVPSGSLQSFLHRQSSTWQLVRSADDLPVPMPPRVLRRLAGKPGVVYAAVCVPGQTDFCQAAVDLGEKDRALVYLYWVRTIEDWTW